MGSAYHKDLLHACESKTFKRPVEKGGIANGQKTLRTVEQGPARCERHTRGFVTVSGRKRLLKLSARITAWRGSSSSSKSFSFTAADDFEDMVDNGKIISLFVIWIPFRVGVPKGEICSHPLDKILYYRKPKQVGARSRSKQTTGIQNGSSIRYKRPCD